MEAKARIIQTALKLFRDYGIRNVTMDRIASEAGVSKRTIYELYSDKTELIRNTLSVMAQENQEMVCQIKSKAHDIFDTLYLLADFHIRSFRSYHPSFFEDLKKFFPHLWDAISVESDETKLNEIQNLLNNGIKAGLIRADLHLRLASRVILELFKLTFFLELEHDRNKGRDNIFENVIINYFRGIATELGTDLIDKYQKEQFSVNV